MPKVKPLGDQWPEHFRAEASYYMGLNGIQNKAELARRMNIPQSTLSRHLRDPSIMTVGELRTMTKVLGMSQEDIGKMIRGTKP